MSDSEGIPAVADEWHCPEETSSDVESSSQCEEKEAPVKKHWKFNGKHIYVTWSKSKIAKKEVFHEKLLELLPAGVRLYGGRELHKDGTPHYHVVMSFPHKVHWPNAAIKFAIDGDTNAIRFEKPKIRQKVADFLENTMSYCEKDGDTFGDRLSLEGSGAVERKRKWPEIIDEPDVEPRAYMLNHPALERAIGKKRQRTEGNVVEPLKGTFRVPAPLDLWMKKYVVERKWKGRPMSLIIVGDPLTGKSAWAESQGRPIVMNSSWHMKSIYSVEDPTHLVVNNVKPLAFGYAGQNYWRDVLGGEAKFNARDFRQETRTITWGLPCVWTCNFDCDPRKDKAVADYIKSTAFVVEVRDRPGEHGWGKLYVPTQEAEEEVLSVEWAEALRTAESFSSVS